ncbi:MULTISPECIES: virulence protein RhuM/Fic/DOC family protein [unclassified Candidatus Tisiphia]|uniref:virulence protein RhuM/Fic/DOC family protein n=1 Tax=unclassified Candidatus Tisiphia TaxID=2996318 RepID=UPI00312C9541
MTNIGQESQIKTKQENKIAIYQSKDGKVTVNVQIYDETVWLSLNQIAEVFQRDKSVISRHLKNIFKEGELEELAVVAKNATTAADGKIYQVEYYNLDAILSVGYRVNSKFGGQFRKWASSVLKEYLINGYSINQQQIIGEKLEQLKQTIELLSTTLVNQNLVTDEGRELLNLITTYSKTWDILIKYDEENLGVPKNLHNSDTVIISYQEALVAVESLRQELIKQGLTSQLFGFEKENGLQSILANLEQSFDGASLYGSLEEKAAHLIYFIIKDHPFSDGNKRIGSLLFLLYLKKSNCDLRKINPSSLTALALLVAESDPKQKELMIKLVINLISND